jgi:hypothetical protein
MGRARPSLQISARSRSRFGSGAFGHEYLVAGSACRKGRG